ncbi:FtsW/RodA/SpoVE family cell cycle protein [Paenibacillus thermotolerans]|uniref:FtsW/RodA/SpoVE family cell cycle protein n=1 Tax=Paenibacillus thermotolerans TaxID=3027807 RepID=UPI0023687313|nr:MULTISPECIES: FtsW/RodA/SpoVE family cell cycle protein [unclassified Paenibacillus]
MRFLDKLKRVDWPIIIILVLFMAASTLIIYSATVNSKTFSGIHTRHIMNYALGFAVLVLSSLLNYRLLVKAAPYLYSFGVALLAAVYFFGGEKNGAKGWFTLPGIGMDVQPAELVKLFLIIMVAYFLARKGGEPLRLIRDVVPAGIIVILPFLLVILMPDLGNAIIYIVILLGMLWIANIKFIHVLIGTSLAVACIAGIVYLVTTYHDPITAFLKDHGSGHWMDRIDAFLDPENASKDDTYQVENSYLAIGSGALFGEGFMKGDSVQKGFIPYTYSDSIFVVVGEEFGFFGSSVLLLLYFLLIYRLILISIQCTDHNGSYIIIGIVSMFVFQIFQNIGMFLKILPLTGITLPFISYGGSSLLINMLSIGLAISIRIYGNEPAEE